MLSHYKAQTRTSASIRSICRGPPLRRSLATISNAESMKCLDSEGGAEPHPNYLISVRSHVWYFRYYLCNNLYYTELSGESVEGFALLGAYRRVSTISSERFTDALTSSDIGTVLSCKSTTNDDVFRTASVSSDAGVVLSRRSTANDATKSFVGCQPRPRWIRIRLLNMTSMELEYSGARTRVAQE